MDYQVQYWNSGDCQWHTMQTFSDKSVAFDYLKRLRPHVKAARMMPTLEYI